MEKLADANMNDVHFFAAAEDFLLLDVNSGNIFIIDEPTMVALNALLTVKGNWKDAEDLLSGEAGEALRELYELTVAGELFTPDAYFGKYEPPAPVLKSLCLNISHDCDLRCAYCFASTGSFGGKRLNMPLEVATAAIDYLLENSADRRTLEVDFFGGEPLMNIDVVMVTVAYAKEQEKQYNKQIRFTFTTNCVSLTPEISKWAFANGIKVILSHDGRKKVHDAMRVFADGSGSYDIVTANIRKHLKNDPRETYYVRGTFTALNKDFTNDILHWLDLGFKHISMEPAVEKYGNRAFKEADLDTVRKEYWRLTKLYDAKREMGEGFDFFHFNIDVEHGPCLPKRLTGCGAGHAYMVVTPEGELYPCHQFVGREQYRLGSLSEGVVKTDIVEKFRNAHVYNKEKCRECWARFHCSGGCHANADLFNEDILKPYAIGCELARMRTECALWLSVQDMYRNRD
ncbi:MAG: thioether cross-link-forming SCIFF peptide maturase [Clostridia bacterium]|nr:thioether cross-link-forming SCIFF peptide maturase [Clostridia bacterium]